MTAAAQAGTTTIGRLACRYALPRDDRDAGDMRARLEHVLERRLAGAVGEALAPLDGADGDAVWLVRSLRADALLPAGVRDLDVLARRWGAQVAGAIVATLRRGPGGNVVRFGTRAEHLAAYVAARCEGGGDTWPFAPFQHLRPLAPATALRVGAEGAGVSAVEAVLALARLRRLEALLVMSRPGAVRALWAACLADAGAAPIAAADPERARAAAAELGRPVAGAPAAARALRLLAALAQEPAAAAAVVPVVDSVVRAEGAAPPPAPAPTRQPGRPDEEARGGDARRAAVEADREPPSRLSAGAAEDIAAFVAAGAPAFMVLPSLAAVGLAPLPAATRARVLSRMLGVPADAAVLLAAGERDDDDVPADAAVLLAAGEEDDDVPADAAVLLAPGERDDDVPAEAVVYAVVRALADDDRLDGRALVREVVDHPDGRLAVAVLRDAVTDVWVGGAVIEPGGEVDWDAIGAPFAAATEVVGSLGAAERQAALARLRPAGPDVAWLAPADDGDLAVGLAARAALRHLARRLLGFDRGTMGYLVDRFLPHGGTVTVAPTHIHAALAPAPLAVVLTMAGLDTFGYRVPWLDRDVLVTHGAG